MKIEYLKIKHAISQTITNLTIKGVDNWPGKRVYVVFVICQCHNDWKKSKSPDQTATLCFQSGDNIWIFFNSYH